MTKPCEMTAIHVAPQIPMTEARRRALKHTAEAIDREALNLLSLAVGTPPAPTTWPLKKPSCGCRVICIHKNTA